MACMSTLAANNMSDQVSLQAQTYMACLATIPAHFLNSELK